MDHVLTVYERKQLLQLEAWRCEEPGFLAQKLANLPYRLEWLIEGAVPEKLLFKALEVVDFSARWLSDERRIIKQAKVDTLAQVGMLSLEQCDALAVSCQRWAVGFGAMEGAATGVTGVSGLAADIPAVLTLAIRTIYQIGYCYGCDAEHAAIQQLAFTIMGIAVTESIQERQQAMRHLQQLTEDALSEVRVIGTPLVSDRTRSMITFRQVSRQIGANLLKRKALQTIPALGALAGGSINAWYINEVSNAARRVFQSIWFRRHSKDLNETIIDSRPN